MMKTDIKNTDALNAEIGKLKNLIREKEHQVKHNISGIRGEGSAKEKRKHLAGEVLKTVSTLLVDRLFRSVFKSKNA